MVNQSTLRPCEGTQVVFRFATAVKLNKCLKQINLHFLLHTCAPNIELPSNTSSVFCHKIKSLGKVFRKPFPGHKIYEFVSGALISLLEIFTVSTKSLVHLFTGVNKERWKRLLGQTVVYLQIDQTRFW